MFLRKRRWLATAGLMAALQLAIPAPSLAAGFWKPAVELPGLAATAWSWLESLGVVRRMPQPARRLSVVWEREGVMIDPNGATTTTTVQATWQFNRPSEEPANDEK